MMWNGIVPFVIVPIPLLLPVGKEEVCFVMHNGNVVSARQTVKQRSGGIAGIFGGAERIGFGALSLKSDELP
jgi:hypothetical protein